MIPTSRIDMIQQMYTVNKEATLFEVYTKKVITASNRMVSTEP